MHIFFEESSEKRRKHGEDNVEERHEHTVDQRLPRVLRVERVPELSEREGHVLEEGQEHQFGRADVGVTTVNEQQRLQVPVFIIIIIIIF